jgi:hypothetical protein
MTLRNAFASPSLWRSLCRLPPHPQTWLRLAPREPRSPYPSRRCSSSADRLSYSARERSRADDWRFAWWSPESSWALPDWRSWHGAPSVHTAPSTPSLRPPTRTCPSARLQYAGSQDLIASVRNLDRVNGIIPWRRKVSHLAREELLGVRGCLPRHVSC